MTGVATVLHDSGVMTRITGGDTAGDEPEFPRGLVERTVQAIRETAMRGQLGAERDEGGEGRTGERRGG